MEPPSKGHVGTRSFVLYREVSFIWRLKCTGIIGIGTSRFVLYREVFFIRSVLYRRFHCVTTLPLPAPEAEAGRVGNFSTLPLPAPEVGGGSVEKFVKDVEALMKLESKLFKFV